MQRRRIEALRDEKFKCKGKQHSWYGEVRPLFQDGANELRNYSAYTEKIVCISLDLTLQIIQYFRTAGTDEF
jgi:hypothetical protein